LSAVATQGDTLEEARVMAADAIHLVLQSLLDHGEPVPVDTAAEPEPRPFRETLTVAIHGV
jgi:predicted RNase H-like HicB family nuclease